MSHGGRMLIVLIISQWLASPAENARILAVETVGAKSHWYFMSAVLRSLTDAGHEVIVFTQFPNGDRENYTEVDTSKDFPLIVEFNVTQIINVLGGSTNFMNIWAPINRMYCDKIYENEKIVEIMANRHKHDFDVIIMEPFALECTSYLANVLNIPIIFTVPSPMILLREFPSLGYMPNPAYVSHMLADHAVPKTFVQRFINVAEMFYGYYKIKYQEIKFKMIDPKPYDSATIVHPSVIFINTHYVIEAARPVLPNLIDISGIHLSAPKSIPKDILDFIENSPNGVIYFTFGSTVKLSSLPAQMENEFKEALAQVPQNILWKYEGEMKDKPNNVMIRKWFPQREVLLHPKVKLFISHGGMSGVYESVDAGVPVLGFPLFYDQPRNIDHLVQNGMAISMNLLTINKIQLLNAITELINNTKYTENAKINSLRFKDRPMSPQQSVVYWTDYVIRHKGAPQLKLHSPNLTWYQYFLLDVILVFLIIIYLVTFIIFKIFKIVKIIFKFTFNRSLNNFKIKYE